MFAPLWGVSWYLLAFWGRYSPSNRRRRRNTCWVTVHPVVIILLKVTVQVKRWAEWRGRRRVFWNWPLIGAADHFTPAFPRFTFGSAARLISKTWPAIILPSSPATAARAFLSLTHWTKAKPLWTEQPTILLYSENIASTSDFLTTRVLRFPVNTWEFMEQGSVLLIPLLAIVFDDTVPYKAEKCSWRSRKKSQEGEGRRDSTLNLLPPSSTWRSR